MDDHGRLRHHARHGKGHGDPVIAPAVNGAAPEAAARDDHPVRPCLGPNPGRPETVQHGLNAVRLLDAQFRRAREAGRPAGRGRGHQDGRKFVDRHRHKRRRDINARERAALDADIGHGFAGLRTFIQQPDIRPHQAHDGQHGMPGRIDADMLQHHIRTRREGRGRDKKGGRGKIGRDLQRAGPEPVGPAQDNGLPAARERP